VFGPAGHRVEQPRGAGLLAGRGEINDNGHVPVAKARVAPEVLVDADRCEPVEAGRVIDEELLSFGKDRVVRSVPRHLQRLHNPREQKMLAHLGAPVAHGTPRSARAEDADTRALPAPT